MFHEDIMQEAIKLLQRKETIALATIINVKGSTPRKAGAKMIVRRDGSIIGTVGGGTMEALVKREALAALAEGRMRLVGYNLSTEGPHAIGALCGGDADVLIEVLKPKATLVVMGAGHVATHVARMGKQIGFEVVVVDDRVEYANEQRFPDVDRLVIALPEDAIPKLELGPHSYVTIMTRGHVMDKRALRECLKYPVAYLGLMASRNKTRTIFRDLEAEGFSREQLNRVRAPIGLDIGAETPAELAVSVIAEIIQVRNGGTGNSLSSLTEEKGVFS